MTLTHKAHLSPQPPAGKLQRDPGPSRRDESIPLTLSRSIEVGADHLNGIAFVHAPSMQHGGSSGTRTALRNSRTGTQVDGAVRPSVAPQ
jgi:hypothetical protein